MRKYLWAAAALLFAGSTWANNIVGQWRTIDDNTKKPRAVVEISESGGIYSGRIVSLAPGVDPNCSDCSGAQQGKPLVGQTVLRGLRVSGDGYKGGKITDPKTGKEYTASAKLVNGGQSLEVRGSIGPFGRTQTWQRVQ